ncbi:MAG: ATP-grasp fold amidoligase family protein [Gemmatimonadales bacterium]
MPAELTPARRRARKFWRRIRSVVAVLPPIAYQWLRHLIWHGAVLPVSAPRTHTHRIFLKMARERNPLLQRTADKLGLRGYVEERLGGGYLPELYGVLDSPEGLLGLELPRRYVVKATHGSGMIALVNADDPETRAAIAERARRWLAYPYWRKNGEWGYRGITPRLIVEEFLDAGDGKVPPDWKWLCFGGRAALVQVFFDRFAHQTRSFYDPEGTPVDLSRYYPAGPPMTLPPSFGAMRAVAERLAEGFDFVRVDLYALGDRVVVGEMTHYPNAGNKVFEPPEWDVRLGALWPERR